MIDLLVGIGIGFCIGCLVQAMFLTPWSRIKMGEGNPLIKALDRTEFVFSESAIIDPRELGEYLAAEFDSCVREHVESK